MATILSRFQYINVALTIDTLLLTTTAPDRERWASEGYTLSDAFTVFSWIMAFKMSSALNFHLLLTRSSGPSSAETEFCISQFEPRRLAALSDTAVNPRHMQM